MLGLYRLFPEMFMEQVKKMSYYANLGLFWEVMAPVFFEMSDIYDEGGFKGVPDAMNFLVNGIFAVPADRSTTTCSSTASASRSSPRARLHLAL